MQSKNFFSKILSRTVLTVILILLQILVLLFIVSRYAATHLPILVILNILSLFIVLYIVKRDDNSSYKLIWVITIMAFPAIGGLFYLYLGDKRPAKKMRKKMNSEHYSLGRLLKQNESVLERIEPRIRCTAKYLKKESGCPVRENTEAEYFSCGEELFPVLLSELKKATHSIYLEFFIISHGVFWDSVLDILEKKAADGVDVRLIYDDMGSMSSLPAKYPEILGKKNIKAMKFNPFIPLVSVIMNHRDHRKIIVIDGKTAFTGGINLADEYINKKQRFGYWKDTAVMIKGDAAWNFTALFAEMWNPFSKDKIIFNEDNSPVITEKNEKARGFFQPFGDSPLDNEQVSESVYLEIISNAREYVYIFTPYLVIDDQMKTALTLAAKRGVDVRIVTPGIPDKKTVFRITRSYYQSLVCSGVKIYEFTEGFIHAKSIVSDDRTAVVGSINMDFRSLYLHFECGVLMMSNYGGEIPAIMKLKEDCLETFKRSRSIKQRESRAYGRSILDSLLKLLGPLV